MKKFTKNLVSSLVFLILIGHLNLTHSMKHQAIPFVIVTKLYPDILVVHARVLEKAEANKSVVLQIKEVWNGVLPQKKIVVPLSSQYPKVGGGGSYALNSKVYIKDSEWIFTLEVPGPKNKYSIHSQIQPLAVVKGMARGYLFDYKIAEVPLKRLKNKLAEIKKGYSEKDLRRYLSYDGTELRVSPDDPIGEKEYSQLKGNAFRDLRVAYLTSENLSFVALMGFSGLPIEDFTLSRQKLVAGQYAKLLKSFKKIKKLNLANSELSDSDIRQLKGASLEELVVYNTKLTDKGVSHIGNFKNLKLFNITGKLLSSKGYVPLKDLKKLESLALSYQSVDDTAVSYLKNLPLKTLSLFETQITDKSLEVIAAISSLSDLSITKSNVTDTGINQLAALKKLESLRLESTMMTDAAMKSVNQLPLLHTLHLFSAPISDRGLEALVRLPKLRYINLQHTKVTKEGVEKFSARYPTVSVVHNLK